MVQQVAEIIGHSSIGTLIASPVLQSHNIPRQPVTVMLRIIEALVVKIQIGANYKKGLSTYG